MRRLLLGLLLLLACSAPPGPPPSPQLDDADRAAIASCFGPAPLAPTQRLLAYRGPVLVVLRRDGERVGQAWGEGSTWWENLARARAQLHEPATTVEICFCHGRQPQVGKLGNVHLGVLGLELETPAGRKRMAPTEMLARNLRFSKAIGAMVDTRSVPPDQIKAFTFQAQQVLVRLGNPPTAVSMERGNEVVLPEAVTRPSLERLSADLAGWLLANLQPDGRMLYEYWPSRGEEAPGNNPLRQFMATWVLDSWPAAREAAARNLAYNMRTFYRDGVIEYRGEVKLGAMAIAALAILDSPERARWKKELAALVRTIESLARPDGSFRTFLRPEKRRNDNQNFYSGEAQLLRARLYVEQPDATRRERFLKSFRYYREFFRRKPNPAFVPWHTRACATFYAREPEPELRDFIFEMNDWLLDKAAMQEWDDAAYPDLRGRFYNSKRPDYGPPHASSTGAYLEGLSEAYRMAREAGDTGRARRYETALLRGARDLLQLEFADDVDMFYVSKRAPVQGGLRTEVYDNEIRVDNVQHALSAVQRMLQVLELPQGQR